jgi:hypothetical protein
MKLPWIKLSQEEMDIRARNAHRVWYTIEGPPKVLHEERAMSEQDNIQVIQTHLAAFGHGDIDAALALVAEEVDWQSPATGAPNPLLPWSTLRRTRAEVGQFFADLSAHAEPEAFEIFAVTAQGDRVVLEGRNRGRARSTGRSYEHDWVMIFTVQDGVIVRHRHYYDPADVLAAFV